MKVATNACLHVIAAALVAACAEPSATNISTATVPTLVPMSRTRLHESDSVFIGMPIGLTVAANGDYFLSEGHGTRVLHFNASGALVSVLGRYGYGPSEFVQPAFVKLVDDTTLLITDQLRRDVVLRDLPHGRDRLRMRYAGMPGFFSITRGRITGTTFDVGTGTIATRWKPPYTTGQTLGKLPPVFMHNNFFAIYGLIPLAEFGDSVAYVAGDVDFVRIADSSWKVVDSIAIPRRIRRGIPAVIDSTMTEGRNIYYVMNQLSNPYAFHRLSDGRYAIIHVDGDFKNTGVTGDLFLTIVKKGERARCVDLLLPVHDDNALARLTFRGDTLYVLDHWVDGLNANAEILKIALPKELC